MPVKEPKTIDSTRVVATASNCYIPCCSAVLPFALAGNIIPTLVPYNVSDATAAEIPPVIPPITPGKPCKKCTPQVSCNSNFVQNHSLSLQKPTTDTAPAMNPIRSEAQGPTTKSDEDPTATPPASVAFCMSSIENLPLN